MSHEHVAMLEMIPEIRVIFKIAFKNISIYYRT